MFKSVCHLAAKLWKLVLAASKHDEVERQPVSVARETCLNALSHLLTDAGVQRENQGVSSPKHRKSCSSVITESSIFTRMSAR